ncbi:hypothetical protein [Aquimarina sp. 2201CG5-10]|uniref:hypothetical protein n=1 Tax=Aquimarina callyspongiae TaxID=3098150 RepID=UPI002AB553BD|nr:hypothetical protein [Aquimarina sp. 2201CG5-10]MDY8136154.1 hypothetical protein [Aquimarina sp. 2201CG5-10]
MATHFNENPSIQDQIKTADIIINGQIIDRIATSVIEGEDDSKIVQTTYKIAVNDVLSGEYKNKELELTIVGGEAEGYTTEKTMLLTEGQNYVLFLGKDVGPGKTKKQFNPVYCSCFEIGKNNQLHGSTDLHKQLYTSKLAASKEGITLKDFKSGIQKFEKKALDHTKELLQIEAEELKYIDATPEILEMPTEETDRIKNRDIGPKRG